MKRYIRKWKACKDGEKSGRSAKRKSSLFGDIAAGIGGAIFGSSSSSSSSSSSANAAGAGAVGTALAAGSGGKDKVETPREVKAMTADQYNNLTNHDFTNNLGISPIYSVGGKTPAANRSAFGKFVGAGDRSVGPGGVNSVGKTPTHKEQG